MRLELAPLRAGVGAEGGAPLASEVELAPPVEADLPQLFGLAKGTFAGLPGWSDERVLEVLKRNLIFVAREEGEAGGYVGLALLGGYALDAIGVAALAIGATVIVGAPILLIARPREGAPPVREAA